MTLQYEDQTATADTQACRSCGVAMAGDQRYCLSCGERSGETRVPLPARETFRTTVAAAPAAAAPRVTPPAGATWAGAVGLLLLAMGVGVLIGRAGDPQPQRASAPPVTVVQGGGAVPVASAAAGAFASDWPPGEKGWTVALQQLPKASTTPAQVAQAKADATAKGAADAGALDTDAHASLEPGNYLVYAGRFSSRKAAAAARRRLGRDFPGARVVQVGSGAAAAGGGTTKAAEPAAGREEIEKLEELSPEEYQKKSKALPKEVGTEGAPPPKDDKPAGGGSDFEEIG